MFNTIDRGIVLIFIPLLTLSINVMNKFMCANQNFDAVAVQHLDELFEANKQVYYNLLENVAAFVGPPQQLYSSSCNHSFL